MVYLPQVSAIRISARPQERSQRYLEQGSAFQCRAEVLSLLRLRHQESREKILY